MKINSVENKRFKRFQSIKGRRRGHYIYKILRFHAANLLFTFQLMNGHGLLSPVVPHLSRGGGGGGNPSSSPK